MRILMRQLPEDKGDAGYGRRSNSEKCGTGDCLLRVLHTGCGRNSFRLPSRFDTGCDPESTDYVLAEGPVSCMRSRTPHRLLALVRIEARRTNVFILPGTLIAMKKD